MMLVTRATEQVLEKVKGDRAFFDGLGKSYLPDSSVQVTEELIEGVSTYWFTPDKYDHNRIVLYLHGGMFGLGSIHSHRAMVSHFATALSSKILFIEYALSPEHPFPSGLNDVVKVYQHLLRTNTSAIISVIGDSAGGGLSVSFIHALLQQQVPLPAHVVLISPWLNLTCDTNAYQTRFDPILNREMLMEYAAYYAPDNLGGADPGQLPFAIFPPLFILVGSNEILFDDSKLFFEKIRQIQPRTRMKEYMDQTHVWLLTDIASASAQTALADMKEFLSE
ncbi:MAG: steryl acetyl hydrolase [Chitinophagaceae bacterium]|nr:MAG: steryl acetyl hydrolase [Chitinophagaceae bacterium]